MTHAFQDHALRTRAVSLAAAFGVCGLALIAIAGARFTYFAAIMPDILSPITSEIEAQPDPQPPPPNPNPTPRHDIVQQAPTIDDLGPTLIETDTGFGDVTPPPEFGGGNSVVVTHPTWITRPTNLERFYPARALRRGIEGEARVSCIVNQTGWLTQCSVLTESPSGWGFGDAAVEIARTYRMQPAMRGGEAVEARFSMTVPFTLR